MIIVDDCSIDNTRQIVEEYKRIDQRIKYHCLERNSGAAIARTTAMRLAQGEYIAFCDSDDLWAPNKLDQQIHFMKEGNYNFTCTAYEQIDEEGNSLNKIIKPKNKCDYNRLLLDCPVGNSSVMYNAKQLGVFDVPNIKKRNDDALWLKILKEEPYIWGLDKVLMKYRIRKNSISSNKIKVIKYHWILYRDIENLGVFRSLFHIGYWGLIKFLRVK